MARVLLAIIWKDFRLEWRTGEVLLTPALLALLLMLVFVFALPPAAMKAEGVFTASLWTTLFFAGTIGVSRGFGRERGDGRLAGLLLAPVDRSAVFLAKALVGVAFYGDGHRGLMPVFFGAFGQTLAGPLWQWLVMTGLVITGVQRRRNAGGRRGGAAAVRGSAVSGAAVSAAGTYRAGGRALERRAAVGGRLGGHGGWLQMLVLYNVLFWGVPYLLFEYVVEV